MGKSQTKLKILLVGVNKYRQPISSLGGCEYDVMNILRTLKSIYEEQLIIEERILLNEEATRENIINKFKSHFSNLGKDDIGLFYFSGHGSKRSAPVAFRHNTPNGMIESLVCHNSHSNTTYEIADKELSVLIWEASKEHDNPFTLILDCCHSGGIRKDVNVKIRGAKSDSTPRSWQDYYGSEYFHFSDGNVTVPLGRYISLSACRPDQYAQEKYIDEKRQGVFTHLLVETLKKCKKPFSYQDLQNQLAIKVKNEAYSQNSQLRSLLDEDLKCLFLSKNQWFDINNPIVFFNKNDQEGMPLGWILNKGSIQGVKKNIDNDQNEVWLYEEVKEGNGLLERKEVVKGLLVDVFPNFSTVFIVEELDDKKQYRIDSTDSYITKITVTFDTGIEIDILDALITKFDSTSFVDIRASNDRPSYSIGIEDDQFVVKSGNEGFKCYKGLAGILNLGIKHLLECLRRIASWHNVKGLTNPDSSIDKNHLKLDFFHVSKPSFNFMEAVKEISIPNILKNSPVLEHSATITKNHQVSTQDFEGSLFKLMITNLSNSRLWVSTLFLGSDFSITNSLMPIVSLDPEECKWLEYYESNEHKPSKLVPLHIEDSFLRQGVNNITEHFKILVSTREFETSMFNQTSTHYIKNRALGHKYPRRTFTPKDWLAIDFSVKVRAVVLDELQM